MVLVVLPRVRSAGLAAASRVRSARPALTLVGALACALAACDGGGKSALSDAADGGAGGDGAAADGGAAGAGAGDAGAPSDGGPDAGTRGDLTRLEPPRFSPERYDCRAHAAGPPARPAGALPLACAFDPACADRFVVAHRAAGGTVPGLGVLAPENTRSAVFAAIAMGVDFVETDPRVTADGVVVNVHDPDIGVSTLGSGRVAELDWAAISALPLRPQVTLGGDFSCERVLTIRELLELSRGRVNVLLDANKLDLDEVPLLVQLVRETDTFAEAVFDTSSLQKVLAARALEPGLKTMLRPDTATQLTDEWAAAGTPPPVIIELDTGTLDALAPAVRALGSARVMVDALGEYDLYASARLPGPERLLELFDRGADLIQTDRPNLALDVLGRLPVR